MLLPKLIVPFLLLGQHSEAEITVVVAADSNLGELSGGISDDNTICCKTGNCICHSLSHALVNLNDNGIIKITSDVDLSSFLSIESVENVTILGYNNPTVLCENNGRGVKFISSFNITTKIIWVRCGYNGNHFTRTRSRPVLQIPNSSNITIQNCTL